MRLLLILTVGFIACGQSNPAPKTATNDTASSSKQDTTIVQQVQHQDSIVTYDSTSYKHFIPQNVLSLVKQLLPQWRIPDPDNWDSFWFKEYKKDSALVNYISGDFNCDNKKDYALLLVNTKEGFAIWVFQSDNEEYKTIKLDELGHMEKPVEVGLQFTEAGLLNYLDANAEDVKSIHLNCPAISIIFFEKAAVTYYWDKSKYKEVQTGD